MKRLTLSFLSCAIALTSACNSDDEHVSNTFTVEQPTLVSFAKLPVETYAEGPTSGKDVQGNNGIYPPFPGQPVQGFSAALKNKDGSYLVMSDNGFGAQDNSADYLLRLHYLKVDFRTKHGGTGQVKHLSYIQLRDPNRLIPFKIVHEESDDRLLTGADFDPESMQRDANGDLWIGDEFGPYLLHFSADGVLKSPPIALPHPLNASSELRSPQNQMNQQNINYFEPLVQRSGGFEGMAISPDAKFLYPILEKPLKDELNNRLIIFEFDIAQQRYTGQYYYFQLDAKATAIGDFQLYADKEGVIIERDDTENNLGGFKKITQIELDQPKQLIKKKELVDLMYLANPELLYGQPRDGDIAIGERFGFPFQTIEDIIIDGPNLITVLNDNNFPGSSGRNRSFADDNEIIQIKLKDQLY